MSGPDGYLTNKCSKKCLTKGRGGGTRRSLLRMVSRWHPCLFGDYVNSVLCPYMVIYWLFQLGYWSLLAVKLRPIIPVHFSNVITITVSLTSNQSISFSEHALFLSCFPASTHVPSILKYPRALPLYDEILTRLQRKTQIITIH